MRLGIDTGGTFTDFVWLDGEGRLVVHKQLSTPHDPSQAILAGIGVLAVPAAVPVVHGSTVATNALLERRGARTALITTAGFADILAIGRQNRPDLYALVPQKAEPLVPRPWRFEVDERVTAQGQVLRPLPQADLPPLLARLEAEGIESVAVCLLFSFLHPEHEQQIGAAIARRNQERVGESGHAPLHVSLSCQILPEYREYERTSTTVINAYVAPLMARYLGRLADQLKPRPLSIMQSNGGIITAEAAGRLAARTVLSGPAGGVVGARFVAGLAGLEQIISFDMGGTSTDVALCPGRLPTTARGEVAGMPLRLPIIDIHTVGAGGGSLARMDAGGALLVGPESAGADPGPACYGQGEKPTTTDANLLLGRLDAGHFLGGQMPLFPERARVALSRLAEAMSAPSPERAAWDVVQVANATMERAIRRISVERGYDPRLFTLVTFGGAGPVHACDLATRLGIPRVLVPAHPGVLSALGMLVAPPARDYSRTVMRGAGGPEAGLRRWLAEQFAPLEGRAAREMQADGFDPARLQVRHSLDMRYVGQSHELTVPLDAGIAAEPLPLAERFHQAHEGRYGYRQEQAPVEIVTLRLAVQVPLRPPHLERAGGGEKAALLGSRPVWFGPEGATTAALLDREGLQPGASLSGPALIVQYDTTTVVPPGWAGQVDAWGNLLLAAPA